MVPRRCHRPRPHHRRTVTYCRGKRTQRRWLMPKDLKNGSVAKDLTELTTLFAQTVLSSEDLKTYYTIMERFLECLKPRDFVERVLVKDLTDSTWEIMRLSRHKTMVIEREHERHLEIQAKRRQQERKEKGRPNRRARPKRPSPANKLVRQQASLIGGLRSKR